MATVTISPDKVKELTRKALGTAIAKNRAKVIALLKKYGVAIDSSYSDSEVIIAVLHAVRSDKKGRFKKDLSEILKDTASSMNFTAEDGQEFFNYVSVPEITNPTTVPVMGTVTGANTSPTTKPKSAFGSALASNLGNIFSTGLNVLSSSLTNKSNQKLADTALAIEAEKTKQAALNAQGGGAGGAGAQPSGLSTGAKIGIGVGVAAVVGLIIYLVVKK